MLIHKLEPAFSIIFIEIWGGNNFMQLFFKFHLNETCTSKLGCWTVRLMSQKSVFICNCSSFSSHFFEMELRGTVTKIS